MNIFEILHERAKKRPSRVILEDEERTYSFSEIENASGRIYRYLKNSGIGKEDIVAIRLPRSGRIPLVMFGVWKAGAAFLTIGEHSPVDYVSCQLEETKPKMIFDMSRFESAMRCDFLDGYEKADEHDLALVVYSTGSGGRFKGSMHEYGAISRAVSRTEDFWKNYPNERLKPTDYRIVFSEGFYSLTAVINILDVIISDYYCYILPYDKIGNAKKTGAVLIDKKITTYTATTRDLEYIKALHSPYLKELSVALDMTSGTYNDAYTSFNYYGMSESGCILTTFRIDRQYDITPIGKPMADIRMKIADKNGEQVKDGAIGEICFVPEYWRGYIGQPEKTKAVFYGGWFHTGDMAYVNADGNYVIVGRKIDIAETKNGYIVPSFIEIEFRKAFPDAEKCHVQIFQNQAEPLICLYYCGKAEYSLEEIRRALGKRLPEHCLPAYCLKMKEFSYWPSGKINRNAFLNPEEKYNKPDEIKK